MKNETQTIRIKDAIKFKKLTKSAKLPTKADEGSACYDLYASDDVIIPPNGRALVKTGLSWEPPECVEMQIRPRSGMALKNGITILNTPGTVDPSYRGEIGVILFNTTDMPYQIYTGDRVAQCMFSKYETYSIIESKTINETARGKGGFGHSGR